MYNKMWTSFIKDSAEKLTENYVLYYHSIEEDSDENGYIDPADYASGVEVYKNNIEYYQKILENNVGTILSENDDCLEWAKANYYDLNARYETMTEWTNKFLPIDGGELVGISQDMWDEWEAEREKINKKRFIFNAFKEYALENGIIEEDRF